MSRAVKDVVQLNEHAAVKIEKAEFVQKWHYDKHRKKPVTSGYD